MVGSYKILEGLVGHFNVLHCHQVKANVSFYRETNAEKDVFKVLFNLGDYKNLILSCEERVDYNDFTLFPMSTGQMRDHLSAKIIAELFNHLEGGHDQIKKLNKE